ncbi:MAG: hypothetical protein QOJ65_1329 [Fimbriimonadaceae bacterium]|jgi:hypothetical protein|nr:hypothetical protein [Fimbriimonadaceae bacterium]
MKQRGSASPVVGGATEDLMLTCLIASLSFAVPQAALAASPLKADRLAPATYYQVLLQARKDAAAGKFEVAASAFERLAAQNPDSGEAWLNLGNSYYELHQPAKAIEPYKRAFALGHGAPENNAYNIGCCYALTGDKKQAIEWVDKALALRFEDRAHLQTDTDLNSLHDDPRWNELAGLPPKKTASRDEKWRYDIDFLTTEMKRMHYRWSMEGLPNSVSEGAKKLKRDVPKLDDGEIMMGLQKLMVQLGDGHSTIYPYSPAIKIMRLPFQVYRFEEGVFILDADQTDLKGSRVLSIGGRPIEELWSKLGVYVSRDNDKGIDWIGPQFLVVNGALREFGATAPDDKVTVKVSKEGQEKEISLTPIPVSIDFLHHNKLVPADPTSAPLYLQRQDDFYWSKAMPEAKALYVQFNQVASKKGESLPAFGVRLRKDLEADPVENLIVDIRHNNGGNTDLEPELIRTLISYSAHGGRIFLITGRNTFSAAQNFENDIVRMAGPIVVGEPSSSKPFFIGESAEFVLPYSQLHGSISTRLHTVNARDQRVWIAPDIPVPVTAADYFAGKDAAMDAVLEVIRDVNGKS